MFEFSFIPVDVVAGHAWHRALDEQHSPRWSDTQFRQISIHANLHLHRVALGKVPFWLVAVFAYLASYTTSLFLGTSRQAGHILLERRTATTPGTSRPTLCEQCVCSLTSYVESLNMKGIQVSYETPLKSWLFQASIRNCLNCVHNCDDHGLLDLKSAVQYMKRFMHHLTFPVLP